MSKELQSKLQTVRKHLGLTQKTMAAKLGTTLSTLRNWEQDLNAPRGFALAALSQRLDELEKSD